MIAIDESGPDGAQSGVPRSNASGKVGRPLLRMGRGRKAVAATALVALVVLAASLAYWATRDTATYRAEPWELAATPLAQGRIVQIFVPLTSCGTPGRLDVRDRADSVLVTYWERLFPDVASGKFGCFDRGLFLLTEIRVSEPLGSRPVYDGSRTPVNAPGVIPITPAGTWQP